MEDDIEENIDLPEDLPQEPTNADLDNIEIGKDDWEWDHDQIVFDDESFEL